MTATVSEQRATVPAEPVALAPAARPVPGRSTDSPSAPVSVASTDRLPVRDPSSHAPAGRSSGVADGTEPLDGRTGSGTRIRDAVEDHTSGSDQCITGPRSTDVAAGPDSPSAAIEKPAAVLPARGSGPFLMDPALLMAAAVVDDLERTRIANENRLRQLTRTEADSDGLERGFGLDLTHPDVARLAGIVEGLVALEHQAVLQLQRTMRAHPLGAHVAATRGLGEKQAARLLAAVGDPYWNTLHDRPRTVSQLWAYCGLHTLPVDHESAGTQPSPVDGAALPASRTSFDAQTSRAGGTQHPAGLTSVDDPATGAGGDEHRDVGQPVPEAHPLAAHVAARRRKGQRANWSNEAKMRAYLIAASCIKAGGPYRLEYDARRAHTAVTHPEWTPGHSHNDGLRVAAKAMLRDLWRAARDLHEATP